MFDIDEAIALFEEKSSLAYGKLNEALAVVKKGAAPSNDLIGSVDTALGDLSVAYENIRTEADRLGCSVADQDGTIPASDCINAIRLQKRENALRALEETRRTLETFIKVRALLEAYAAALRPLQEDARKQLGVLKNDEAIQQHKDEIADVCAKQKMFLQAISIEDFDSPEGILLLDELENFLPAKVAQGLMLHKYYLPESANSATNDTRKERLESSETDALTDSCDAFELRVESCAENRLETDGETVAIIEDATGQEKTSDSAKNGVNPVRHYGESLPIARDEGKLHSLTQVRASKGISAASFKRELLEAPAAVRLVIPILSKLGVITKSQIVQIASTGLPSLDSGVAISDSLDIALFMLARKSVISSFRPEEDAETAYCLTSYGRAILTKESISEMRKKNGKPFWPFSVKPGHFSADNEVVKSALTAAQESSMMTMLALLSIARTGSADSLSHAFDLLSYADGRNTVSFTWNDNVYTCALTHPDDFDKNQGYPQLLICSKPELSCLDMPDEPQAAIFWADGESLMEWRRGWSPKLLKTITDENEPVNTETSNGPTHTPSSFQTSRGDNAVEGEQAAEICPLTKSHRLKEDAISKDLDIESAESAAATPSSKSMTGSSRIRAAAWAEGAECPSDDDFVDLALDMLDELCSHEPKERGFSRLGAVLALMQAASMHEENVNSRQLFAQLQLATGIFLDGSTKATGEDLTLHFQAAEGVDEALELSAYCLAMMTPDQPYDYVLQDSLKLILDRYDEFFPTYPHFKSLFNELRNLYTISFDEGLSKRIVNLLGNQQLKDDALKTLCDEARELIDEPRFKTMLHGLPEFSTACFGKGSDLQQCMIIVANNKTDQQEFVELVLGEFVKRGEGTLCFDESAIDAEIDNRWREATKGHNTKRIRKLDHWAGKTAKESFLARLEMARRWLDFDDSKIEAEKASRLKDSCDLLKKCADELLTSGAFSSHSATPHILLWMVSSILARVEGSDIEKELFTDFLRTGYVSIQDSGTPLLDDSFDSVKYYEPWRNVLRHIACPHIDWAEVKENISNPDSRCFDNLRQLKNIGSYLGDDSADFIATQTEIASAVGFADKALRKFKDQLEIDYAYNRINEIQKEDFVSQACSCKSFFYEVGDYGCWRQFLDALRCNINEISSAREESIAARINSSKTTASTKDEMELLERAERLLQEERNYAVVEEYLNQVESGNVTRAHTESLYVHEEDSFAEFISPDVFDVLYDACVTQVGRNFGTFASEYIKKRFPATWSSRQKSDSENLIGAWPLSSKRGTRNDLSELIRSIGINARGSAELQKKEKYLLYQLKIKPSAKDRADYDHPISAFGTQASPLLNVFILNGNHTANEIIKLVASENIVGMAIVVINYPLSLAVRREIAELVHTSNSRLSQFLVLDQVLLLHLALHTKSERLPIFLKCSLPFTYYQPFLRDGGQTPDEMFCGRTSELRTIVDPNGATVVYGGRQLGKTALLKRAESLCHKPTEKRIAVYVNAISCDSEKLLVKAIRDALRSKAELKILQCDTLAELCSELSDMMSHDEISRLLILIDEVDNFLISISHNDYIELQPLIDLRRETTNEFKFVLAGLHNVSRAKNATSRNGVFGQLGEPLCVKPLAPSEALSLVSRPLTYLGFQVDRYPHLETILANTNYYPGILQFFGYTLVDSMTRQYGEYYRAVDENPPFTLQEPQLGSIMSSSDLNNSIKEKFRLSLELDPRYFMIARCAALLYYFREAEEDLHSFQRGFSPTEIKNCAREWQIRLLESLSLSEMIPLLDEMVDMGILVRVGSEQDRYKLRKYAFLNIIGSSAERILDDIESTNGEEANERH